METITSLALFAFVALLVSCVSGCDSRNLIEVAHDARPTFAEEMNGPPRHWGPDAFGVVCYQKWSNTLSCVKVQ